MTQTNPDAPQTARDGIALIIRAAHFAADRHRDQRRKDVGATPYINHPLSLAHILSEDGGIDDPEILAAALLHDTVEDTETSHDELVVLFGKRIAGIVAEVTDDKSLDKAERKRRQITSSAGKSDDAKLVKLADKISNLRDIAATPPADWDLQRRQEYFDWARDVVAGLRGVNNALEMAFDKVYQKRPARIGTVQDFAT